MNDDPTPTPGDEQREASTEADTNAPDKLGELAVRHKMVTDEHVAACLAEQRRGVRKPLGQLLLEGDYLTIGQLNYLVQTQAERLALEEERAEHSPEDALFGKLAVHRGLISQEQLDLAIREKAMLERLRIRFRLGEILIKKGALTPHQVQVLLGIQNKRIFACQRCNCRFNIEQTPEAAELRCTYCGEPLVPIDASDDSVVVRASVRMPAAEALREPPPPDGP